MKVKCFKVCFSMSWTEKQKYIGKCILFEIRPKRAKLLALSQVHTEKKIRIFESLLSLFEKQCSDHLNDPSFNFSNQKLRKAKTKTVNKPKKTLKKKKEESILFGFKNEERIIFFKATKTRRVFVSTLTTSVIPQRGSFFC